MSGYRWFNHAYDRNVIRHSAKAEADFSKSMMPQLAKLITRAMNVGATALSATSSATIKRPMTTGAVLYGVGKYADKSDPQRTFNPFAAPYAGVDPGVSTPVSMIVPGKKTSGKLSYSSDGAPRPELGHDPEDAVKSHGVSANQALGLITQSLLNTLQKGFS